jgi:hypothetical protein
MTRRGWVKGRGGIDDWRFTVPADAPLVPKTCMDTTVGTSPFERFRRGTAHGAVLLLAAPPRRRYTSLNSEDSFD